MNIRCGFGTGLIAFSGGGVFGMSWISIGFGMSLGDSSILVLITTATSATCAAMMASMAFGLGRLAAILGRPAA
jgi:hypothetical protein